MGTNCGRYGSGKSLCCKLLIFCNLLRVYWFQYYYFFYFKAEPVGSTRPSSAIFGYPTLQAIGNMNTLANMSNLGEHFFFIIIGKFLAFLEIREPVKSS